MPDSIPGNEDQEQKPDQYDAFVSYSKKDENRVRDVVALMRLADRRVFWAADSIETGADWEDSLKTALSASAQIVVLVLRYFQIKVGQEGNRMGAKGKQRL
jgi:hypothetical protein